MALDDYRSALVTGASSGIGAAVVRSLRAHGVSVHAMARRQQRLDALAEETGCVSTEFFDAAIDDPDKRAALKETGINELTAEDISDAAVYALDAPWRVNVSLIELQPTEQVFGGVRLAPTD
jgi:NADP-dependent 3-hydroxy acid dehydrogenase YdfG